MNESIRNLMQRLISENIRDLGIHVQPVFSTIGAHRSVIRWAYSKSWATNFSLSDSIQLI